MSLPVLEAGKHQQRPEGCERRLLCSLINYALAALEVYPCPLWMGLQTAQPAKGYVPPQNSMLMQIHLQYGVHPRIIHLNYAARRIL